MQSNKRILKKTFGRDYVDLNVEPLNAEVDKHVNLSITCRQSSTCKSTRGQSSILNKRVIILTWIALEEQVSIQQRLIFSTVYANVVLREWLCLNFKWLESRCLTYVEFEFTYFVNRITVVMIHLLLTKDLHSKKGYKTSLNHVLEYLAHPNIHPFIW